jgi:uncharacterized protein (DUF342 family)
MGEEREIISGCPSCGCKYKVPLGFEGRTLTCKKCGNPFRLTKLSGTTSKNTIPRTAAGGEKSQGIGVDDPCLVMGRLAVKYCYADEAQVREALAFQARERQQGRERPLGEILVEKGMISQDQLECIVSVQRLVETRQLDSRFGTLAVQNGFAREADIEKALEEQKRYFKEKRTVKRIGDILVEAGIMSPEQKEGILERQKRLGLGPENEPGSPETAAEPPKGIEVTVAEDGLSAAVAIKPDHGSVDVGDVKAALAARGVCYGIADDRTLDLFVSGEQGKGPFKAAQGMAPVPGGEATIRHLFNMDPLRVGEIKEGGNIDFRERGPVPQVRKGDLLAEKVYPDDGIPGVDVFGKELPPPVNKDVKLRQGKGTRISDDGMKLYADTDGRPEVRADGKIYVFSDLEIDGDVDLKTGHLDFQGNIVVAGAVQDGFRVKGGSLTANEILRAEIETTGDVAVFGGIIGATIRCGGHVRARYIHDARIEALGDIVVEKEIIDSKIETCGVCSVKKGHVLSCHIQAKKGMEAAEIGSDSSRQCILVVGTNERARGEVERLKGLIQEKNQEKKGLDGEIQDLERESMKIHSQIGTLAQQQDRALVNKRKLTAKVDEIKKINASGQLEAAEKLLEKLEQEIREREELLDTHLESQEKLSDQISKIQEESRRLGGEIAAVEEEISSIAEWAQADRGNPYVRVSGSINQYTSVKGIYASLILPETHKGVLIKEIRVRGADDKPEWKMKITRV